MERSDGYEPIILDLQKSKALRQPKRYVLVAVISVIAVIGALATVAVFYTPKPVSEPRVLPTPIPTSIPTAIPTVKPTTKPTIAPTPTPVAAVVRFTPTPRPQPTATMPPPMGALTLYSSPANAEVAIDGKSIGRTPLVNYALKPGDYLIKFAYQGMHAEQKITITAGQTSEYTYRFKGFGSLTITATSSGSDVFVNGTLAGQSPLTVEGLPPGTYHLSVRKTGYLSAEKTVTLGKGEHQDVLITIKRLGLILDSKQASPPPSPPRPSFPVRPR